MAAVKQKPIIFLFSGLIVFVLAGFWLYYAMIENHRLLGNYADNYTLSINTTIGRDLPLPVKRQYLVEIEQIAKEFQNKSRGEFLIFIGNLDFVKKVKVEKKIWVKNSLQVSVFIPLAYIALKERNLMDYPMITLGGKILKNRKFDLPVLYLLTKSVSVSHGYLRNDMVEQWIEFLSAGNQEKGVVFFHFLSELIIREPFTEIRMRSIRTRFILPRTPFPNLDLRLDATYRYLRKKGIAPVEVDLRGESAILKPGNKGQ